MKFLSKENIISLYKKYKDEIPYISKLTDRVAEFKGQQHREEFKILYLFLREFKPKIIYEVSPGYGWTTLCLQLALKDISHKIYSFDIGKDKIKASINLLHRFGLLNEDIYFFEGDVSKTFKKLKDKKEADFILIDCDHTIDNISWLLNNVVPYLKNGGLLLIHDIKYLDRYVEDYNKLPITLHETNYVIGWLKKNKDYYDLLHIPELLKDDDYIEQVKHYGGGDLSFPDGFPYLGSEEKRTKFIIGSKYRGSNPTLWLKKKGEANE